MNSKIEGWMSIKESNGKSVDNIYREMLSIVKRKKQCSRCTFKVEACSSDSYFISFVFDKSVGKHKELIDYLERSGVKYVSEYKEWELKGENKFESK